MKHSSEVLLLFRKVLHGHSRNERHGSIRLCHPGGTTTQRQRLLWDRYIYRIIFKDKAFFASISLERAMLFSSWCHQQPFHQRLGRSASSKSDEINWKSLCIPCEISTRIGKHFFEMLIISYLKSVLGIRALVYCSHR